MFSNTIEFSTDEKYIKNYSNCLPEPIKLNIPQWFKNLNHAPGHRTIKGCMPFLDTLTSGYILKMPVDYFFSFNEYKDNEMGTLYISSFEGSGINLNNGESTFHDPRQLGSECPFNKKNKGNFFHKILNPWTIKTPPGYSCLFLPPMNNSDDRFSIIPGIVDTDSFPEEVNFPIIFNGDKYPVLRSTIKIGTPYVQVFPFKRDTWKMKITPKKDSTKSPFEIYTHILHNYKNKWWHRKSWK